MKGPQFIAWLIFLISYISGLMSPAIAGFGALACGVVRKGGYPQMSGEYVQRIVTDENT